MRRPLPAPPPTPLLLCCLALLCCLCVPTSVRAQATWPTPVAQALERAAIPLDAVSLVVQDVDAAQPLVALNARRPMNPASTMKLVTAFAALELLGPAYTWKTEIYLGGPLHDGVVQGDLIVHGGGDPELTVERLWLLLAQLRARGVRDIHGDLVLDRSYFDPGVHDRAQFDAEPLRAYNVGADALLVNFNTVRFSFYPNANARDIAIVAVPPLAQLQLENDVHTTDRPCADWRGDLHLDVAQADNQARVRFSGTMPRACGERTWAVSLLDAPHFAAGALRALWQSLGGTLRGTLRTGTAPTDRAPFATLTSRSAAEVVRDMNKYSSNILARQLFLTLSAEKLGPPGRYAASAQLVGDWLAHRGLDLPGLVLENGSGLSRIERISAAGLVHVLLAAWHGPLMPEFIASLPVVAQDGTMRQRLREEAVAGQAHVKTGSLADVRSLAGFVYTNAGRRLAFAFIINHANAAGGQAAQDALLRWLHEYQATTGAPALTTPRKDS